MSEKTIRFSRSPAGYYGVLGWNGQLRLIGWKREVKMRRDTFDAQPDSVLDDPVRLF